MRSRVGRSGRRTRASSSGSAPWVKKKKKRDPGWQARVRGGGRAGRALTLVPAPGADLVPAFARTKMFVRRVERVAAERAILARVVVVLVGRHRLAVCTLPHRAKKIARSPTPGRCVLPRLAVSSRASSLARFLSPPKALRCTRREVATAASQAHQRLTSGMTRDWKKKEPASRDGHVIGRHFEIDLGEKFKSSSSAPRAVTRYEYARSRRDCGVERTRS